MNREADIPESYDGDEMVSENIITNGTLKKNYGQPIVAPYASH
jgi:hypothetical protein